MFRKRGVPRLVYNTQPSPSSSSSSCTLRRTSMGSRCTRSHSNTITWWTRASSSARSQRTLTGALGVSTRSISVSLRQNSSMTILVDLLRSRSGPAERTQMRSCLLPANSLVTCTLSSGSMQPGSILGKTNRITRCSAGHWITPRTRIVGDWRMLIQGSNWLNHRGASIGIRSRGLGFMSKSVSVRVEGINNSHLFQTPTR